MDIITSNKGKTEAAVGWIYVPSTANWKYIRRLTHCLGMVKTTLDMQNPEVVKYHNHDPNPNEEKLIRMVMGDGNLADVEACLEQGADPNYMNKYGAGAIHYTITHSPLDKVPVIELLLRKGADINLLTYEKDTSMNLVIKTESLRPDGVMVRLVEKFLDWGTDFRQKDLDGKDALTLAREKEYDDIVSLLIQHSGMGPRQSFSQDRTSRQIEMSFRAKLDTQSNLSSNYSN